MKSESLGPAQGRTAGAVFLRCLALNAGALALVVGAGEIVARALPVAGSLPSHFVYQPGRTFRYAAPPRGAAGAPEYDNEITLNRYGFHGPDHPPLRKAGTKRVALLGDSMVEAFQVRREATMAARLEEALPGVEVLGFGRSGHSTIKQEEILRLLPGLLAAQGKTDPPDVVVFVIHGPYSVRQTLVDFVRPRALWRRGLSWGLLHYDGPSLFLREVRDSVLLRLAVPTDDLLAEAWNALRPGYRSPLLDRAWGLLEGATGRMSEAARASGMRPVFVYVPDQSETGKGGPDHDPAAVGRMFESLARRAGTEWIDLGDAFRAAAGPDGGGCFYSFDQHLTPKGHALVALLLAERLRPLLAVPSPGGK